MCSSDLSAALEASEAGASVLLVESEAVVGGSTRLAHGLIMGAGTRFQREQGIEDTAEALYAYYQTLNTWSVQPSLARRLARDAGPSIEWLADLGVPFVGVYPSGDELQPRGHATGGGQSIIDPLYAEIRRRAGIDVAFGRRVDRLLAEHGEVVGVAVGDDTVRAKRVVMTCGGFGADKGMLATWYPACLEAAGSWLWFMGGPGSRGDGLRLGAQVDAQIVGRNRGQMGAMRPDFGRYTDTYFPGWLLIVNEQGRRFFNEMAPYSVQDPLLRAQVGPVFAIFDQAAKQAAVPHSTAAQKKVALPGEEEEDWISPKIDAMVEAGKVERADTLADLAVRIAVPARNLAATVERYNGFAEAGMDIDFEKPFQPLAPVATPPFYATELRLYTLALTSCGPRIDDEGRVLDQAGLAIPGLFAAGECTGGVLGDVYAGSGNALANAVVFGRAAGRVAGREALKS